MSTSKGDTFVTNDESRASSKSCTVDRAPLYPAEHGPGFSHILDKIRHALGGIQSDVPPPKRVQSGLYFLMAHAFTHLALILHKLNSSS